MGRRVLFVCLGNIYRSQIAEILFNRMFRGYRAYSAALDNRHAGKIVGNVLREKHIEVLGSGLKAVGIDITRKRSKHVKRKDVEKADWVFVMERPQVKMLSRRFPKFKGKIFLLGEFAHLKNPDMADFPKEPNFRKTAGKIRKALEIIKKRRLFEKGGA